MPNLLHAQKSLRHLNAFINIPKRIDTSSASSGALEGLAIAVKDNICTTDLPTTCGSLGLKNYTSPYDATVVARLKAAGAVVAGKTGLDEFGMGSHSTHSAFGPVRNSISSLSAGGSSGGSAVAVATEQCHAALGTDTGGSVRLPAAYDGVHGFKPSYGLVSRWGVVAYANSLDTVGFLAPDVPTLRSLFATLSTHDPLDPTNLSLQTRSRLSANLHRHRPPESSQQTLRIGVPAEYNITSLSPSVRQAWHRALHYVRAQGHTLHTVNLPTTRHALSAYYVLAPAEASSNLAKYDGVRYGAHFDSTITTRFSSIHSTPASTTSTTPSTPSSSSSSSPPPSPEPPLYATTRHHSFHPEVRRRILLGTYTLSSSAINNYFMRAQRVRRLVQQDFNNVFALPHALTSEPTHPGASIDANEAEQHEVQHTQEQEAIDDGADIRVDVLITPTAPTLPPPIRSILNANVDPIGAYATDVFTVPASLAGLPAISVPVAIDEDLARQEMRESLVRAGELDAGVDADAKVQEPAQVPRSAGVQVIAQFGDDELCLRVADLLAGVVAPPPASAPAAGVAVSGG